MPIGQGTPRPQAAQSHARRTCTHKRTDTKAAHIQCVDCCPFAPLVSCLRGHSPFVCVVVDLKGKPQLRELRPLNVIAGVMPPLKQPPAAPLLTVRVRLFRLIWTGVFRENGEVDFELVEAFFHPGVEQDGFRAVESNWTLHALSVIGVPAHTRREGEVCLARWGREGRGGDRRT